jgi:hypothetical protein
MITPEAAEAIARARAASQGWGVAEPLVVKARRGWTGKIRSYSVDSNPAMRGAKVRFTIDAATGEILSEGFLPR